MRKVMVWWMKLGSATGAAIAGWQACLDSAELLQADRFYFVEDRSAYIAAHWLVRSALSSICGVPAKDWRFTEEPGKPKIAQILNQPELQFSLSHTRGLVACAVSAGSIVGIDVENFSEISDVIDIAEQFFSTSEVEILRNATPDQQSSAFIRLWTLKEAFVKATGEGLHRAFDSFSFTLDPVSIAFDPDSADEPSHWTFVEHRPTLESQLAVAIRHPAGWPVSFTVYQLPRDAAIV